MKRFLQLTFTLAAILVAAQTAAAQEWSQPWARERIAKSPRHSEWVSIKHDGRGVETLIVYPEAKDKRPVVLVIHEIFGLSDWAQELADELAAAGYIAVAPDLLSGMGPNGGRTKDFASGGVMEAVSKLPPDQVTADLNSAADYGLKLPASNGKLFVAGFCWGGGQTFRFATNRGDLSGAFVFYGPPPAKDAMGRIKAPVYGFYGGDDFRITGEVPKVEKRMKALGKNYVGINYEGAAHGFLRVQDDPKTPPDPAENAANVAATKDGWPRTVEFLKKNLGVK